MIKKELEILRETEQECREMLSRAEQERLELLRAAREEAKRQHEAMTQEAHEEGRRHMLEAAAQETAERAVRLAQWEAQVQRVMEKGNSRLDAAVYTIFEGMWTNGNRTDDQLQPDDA